MRAFVKILILLSSISVILVSRAEIDDSSFYNDGRYALLKDVQLKKTESIDLHIQFIPPKQKKVNTASFVKIWEKENNQWKLVRKITAEDSEFNKFTNKLNAKTNLHKSDSEAAVEVEFIYCNKLGGGQCDMERFLTKVIRNKNSKETAIKLSLKV